MSNLPIARGMAGELLLAAQSDAVTAATTGFAATPFYLESLAESGALDSDPIIGGSRHNNRDARAAAPALISHAGGLTVPMCLNNIGWWLQGAFGDPVTTTEAATGELVFSDQPAADSTITINGTVITFVSGSPGSDEVQIGATLADTITALVSALNGSADTDVDDATYDEADGTTLTIEHDTSGPTGNSFTLAASAGSNATVSAATLTGGCYVHTFASGGESLPSRTIGVRKRVVSGGDDIWRRNIGVLVNTMQFGLAREAGYRRVAMNLVGISQSTVLEAVFGSPATALALDQIPAAKGVLRLDDVDVGRLMRNDMTYDNRLAPSGEINNAQTEAGFILDDEAMFSGSITTRYSSEAYYDWAKDESLKSMEMEWSLAAGRSLTLTAPYCRAEPHDTPINGPGGLQATVNVKAEQGASNPMLTAVLRNALNGYPVS